MKHLKHNKLRFYGVKYVMKHLKRNKSRSTGSTYNDTFGAKHVKDLTELTCETFEAQKVKI